ncbi:MAG: hypothetical protein L6V92_03835 [Phocaeicola vulgatus]|nr:MAG: hypothetical protein L6V92_03835 [Phocaeicola vulgatus]
MREIEIEDLLPRDEIEVNMEKVGALLRGKKVLITGSAGSIGSEMVPPDCLLQTGRNDVNRPSRDSAT